MLYASIPVENLPKEAKLLDYNYEDESWRNRTLVRQDINFLEYPMWSPSNSHCNYISISTSHGIYTLSTEADRLPDKADRALFYILLSMLRGGEYKVEATRYKLCKRLFGNHSSQEYKRIDEGLERLAGTLVQFQGNFYKNGNHVSAVFRYIDSIHEDNSSKKLEIGLNKSLVNWLNRTNFVCYVDITKFIEFRKPVSARLYEIFLKDFRNKNSRRSINILDLRDRLGIQQAFPSHIYRLVKFAVDEINTRVGMNINLDYADKSRVLTFYR